VNVSVGVAHVALIGKAGDLLALSLQVVVLWVSHNEVQGDEVRLDILQFVLLACSQIFSLDRLTHLPGEHVIDPSPGAVRVIAGVSLRQKLALRRDQEASIWGVGAPARRERRNFRERWP
jgi:hypothetical protein